MTGIQDLAPCGYFGEEFASRLRAVGWLSPWESFAKGETSGPVFDKLKSLLVDPWQPLVAMGVHECELCQFDGPVGGNNLFVPGGSVIYVCPELIVHYIAAHHYRPPDEFLAAVLACPDTRTMEYKKLLLASGGGKLLAARR
jgi:hypothetical protein